MINKIMLVILRNIHTILLIVGCIFIVYATYQVDYLYGLYATGVVFVLLAILINKSS